MLGFETGKIRGPREDLHPVLEAVDTICSHPHPTLLCPLAVCELAELGSSRHFPPPPHPRQTPKEQSVKAMVVIHILLQFVTRGAGKLEAINRGVRTGTSKGGNRFSFYSLAGFLSRYGDVFPSPSLPREPRPRGTWEGSPEEGGGGVPVSSSLALLLLEACRLDRSSLLVHTRHNRMDDLEEAGTA